MDLQCINLITQIKPSGKFSRFIQEICGSKYLLVYSANTEEESYIDIFDIKDYSKAFSEKRKNLCYIAELRCGNFVMSYEKGKIEIGCINYETKSLNILQTLEDHGSDVYDVKELSNGNLVSCSNNGEIIFWSLNPALNVYEKKKYFNFHPDEYSSILEDTKRNKLICAPCFDSSGTCIIDLNTYEKLAIFEEIAGNGGNEIYFVNDNIVIDNSSADEVGLFFIDMDKNKIVKHDEKFNDNKSSCFLKLKNGNLLCAVVVENKKMNLSGSSDEEENNNDSGKDIGRTDLQCWKIDETGLNWKLLFTKEKADNYPVSCMIQLSDGKIVTGSNLIKVYN